MPLRLLGTRFTNATSCFEPGPQELYRKIFLNHDVVIKTSQIHFVWFLHHPMIINTFNPHQYPAFDTLGETPGLSLDAGEIRPLF
jgi:hypothetical protein